MKVCLAVAMAAWVWASALWAAGQPQPPGAATIDYQRQVHTILATQCLGCHSAERRSGGLSLASYADALEGGRSGAAIRPGNAAGSLLVGRITGQVPPSMPLGKPALSAGDVATIRLWIDEGARATPASAAAAPKWEAPLALERPAIPDVVRAGWTTPVDRFTAAYLAGTGGPLPELVGDAAFARRAFLDIWGLLPPPDDLRAFVADANADKRRVLIERLLADNDTYAQHWISFWNDVLRNDEGVNYHSETSSRKSISAWLLSALNRNVPYNRFIEQLLNPAAPGDPDGFLVGVNWRGEVSASQTPAMQAAQNSAQVFLGINLKCNSCHDSFISKWQLKDAYGLASFFSEDGRLRLYRCDVAQDVYATPAFLFPELNRVPPSASLPDRRRTAAAIFTDPRNGRMPRTIVNRMWHRLLGRGLVENPDEMDGVPWSPGLLDWLASDFVDSGYDLKRLIATIVSSKAYQLRAVPRIGEQPRDYVFRGPEIRRLTAEQFGDAIGAITGDWNVYQPPASTAPGGAGPPPARLYARMADAGQSACARARPADSRSGVHEPQHDGDDASGAGAGERRATVELAASRRAKHAGRIAARRRRCSSRRSTRAARQPDRRRHGSRPRRSTSACPARPGSGSSRRTRTPRRRQGRGRVGGRCIDRCRRCGDAAERAAPLDASAVRARGPARQSSTIRLSSRRCASRHRHGSSTTLQVADSPGSAGSWVSNTCPGWRKRRPSSGGS